MADFYSLYTHGFLRIASCTPEINLARPQKNAKRIVDMARECADAGASIIVFPELCVTGASLGDLFFQDSLIHASNEAVKYICKKTADLPCIVIVGAPIRYETQLFNCAVVMHDGGIEACVPKVYIPEYGPVAEKRIFTSGAEIYAYVDLDNTPESLMREGGAFPYLASLSPYTIFTTEHVTNMRWIVALGEDIHAPIGPAQLAAVKDVDAIINISALASEVGGTHLHSTAISGLSATMGIAILQTNGNAGESSTAATWSPSTRFYENGELLIKNDGNVTSATYCDIDISGLAHYRTKQSILKDSVAFGDRLLSAGQQVLSSNVYDSVCETMTISLQLPADSQATSLHWEEKSEDASPAHYTDATAHATVPATHVLRRTFSRYPFFGPGEDADARCKEVLRLQARALLQRLQAIGNPKIVLGVSGGLDSTQALLTSVEALRMSGRPYSDIIAYTMPGFGTTDTTKSNAYALCKALGVELRELDIRPSATQMLEDMGHPFGQGQPVYDVTFENVQAGLRTDYLFRIAGHEGGIVLGTGDLSESALGWCTFGVGDHMSHYDTNADLPKTAMQQCIRWAAESNYFGQNTSEVLTNIVNTEISPELIPADEDGKAQSTQDTIGPYDLHDFFLFYLLKGYAPEKIAYLAWHTWRNKEVGTWPRYIPEDVRREYTLAEITYWLKVFLKRFFTSQYKRSTSPNGPRLLAGGSLSPSVDWRMPSDVSGSVWLEAVDTIPTDRDW
ncbi:NAD(+) synthase [Actinotignum urinale]|uniref:NAD(+) synthase n=1 Tax=Actinotignum urinale TaxID=190146 RepID=UPI000C7FBBE7|nr:NAD(+) synthase [Actinotignum urinale]WIK58630.1 NAD(+) synthase [Actinotignum urinale]